MPQTVATSHQIYRPPLVRERPTYDTPPLPSDFLLLVPEALDTVGNKHVEGWTGAEVLARRPGPRPTGPQIASPPLLSDGRPLWLWQRWEVPGPHPKAWENEPLNFSEKSQADEVWAKTGEATLADFDDEEARWKRLDLAVKMLLRLLRDGKVAVSIIDERTGSTWPMIPDGWSTEAAVRFLELGQDLKRWQKPSFGEFLCNVDGRKEMVTGHVIVSKADLEKMLLDPSAAPKAAENVTVATGSGSDDQEAAPETKERTTLLLIIAGLAALAKLDLAHPSAAASAIKTQIELLGATIGATTIEGHLKRVDEAIERRSRK